MAELDSVALPDDDAEETAVEWVAPVVALQPARRYEDRKRKRTTRPSTENVRHLTKQDLEFGRRPNPTPKDAPPRPKTRGECAGVERPCPYVSCQHHLYLDVDEHTGSIKRNFPDLDPDQLAESCALDVAERGGATLEEVAEILNVTRERIRQIEVTILAKMRAARELGIGDYAVDGAETKRRLPMLRPRLLAPGKRAALLTEHQVAEIRRLRSEGRLHRDIAAELGIAQSSVARTLLRVVKVQREE